MEGEEMRKGEEGREGGGRRKGEWGKKREINRERERETMTPDQAKKHTACTHKHEHIQAS